MTTPTIDLYTPTDVKKVREQLLIEQDGLCAITGLEIPPKQACLDHSHQTQKVRAVAHRQSNAALGKLENIATRYLSYWYPGKLSDFLRQCAAYLENSNEDRWYHPGWIKRVKADFNKLNETQKKSVLSKLGQPEGNNTKERKELFGKVVLDRGLGFEKISSAIKSLDTN
jgi:hypothetical protein